MRNAEVIRQWQVLREIEARRAGVTIHELAEQCRVSTRTIRRDLQALQEAGFAIYDEGAGNETKRWKLDTAAFHAVTEGLTISDVAALYLSRSVVEALSGWPLADDLRAAFGKIEEGLNTRTREFLAGLPEVISAKAGPRARPATAPLADITRRLLDAVGSRRVVRMQYFSAASNRAKTYIVEPYRLALAQGGLYLVGWVPQYDEFRTFATQRIERLSVTDDVFRKTRPLPEDYFGASMGVFRGEPIDVVLEFTPRIAPHIQGRQWHASERLDPIDGGGLRMTLSVTNDWSLRSWILGFGRDVVVVAPRELADAIRDELGASQARYD